jgi:hypothetical protein
LTREQAREYLLNIHSKAERIFHKLDDHFLAAPIMENRPDFTYADVILKDNQSPTVKWIAHNEKDSEE